MSRRAEALAFALALPFAVGSCERGGPAPYDAGALPDAASVAVIHLVPPKPTAAPDDAGTETDGGTFDASPYLAASVRSARSIGHTSVVLRLELGSGRRAAWKPRSRRGGERYKGEIAAYRLATALGVGANVPPAFPRTFAAEDITRALTDARDKELFTKEAVATGGDVPGALIPWIDDLEFLPLEKEPLWSRLRIWLTAGQSFRNDEPSLLGKLAEAQEPERRAIARQASTMILFDYLTANFDRWSGGNVGWLPKKQRVLFIDNDGAFLKTPPKDAVARNERLAFAVDRTSKSFVEALRALDDAKLARAIGEDESGKPLLPPDVLAGIVARRKTLLAKLDEKRAKNGEAETYFFP